MAVFGGGQLSQALAGDYTKACKVFMEKGLRPKCYSSIHMHDIMHYCGRVLKYGRDDLGSRREIVLTWDEPDLYEVLHVGLRDKIVEWISNVARIIQADESVIIFIAGHGSQDDGSVQLAVSQGMEYLTIQDINLALQALPINVRVLVVNLACFSGQWGSLASTPGRDVLVEASTGSNEVSLNYRSGSGEFRCSVFGQAYVNDITTFPDGIISDHGRRIREEVQSTRRRNLPANYSMSNSQTIPSSGPLLNVGLTHFMNSTEFIQSILGASNIEDRDRYRKRILSRVGGMTKLRQLCAKLLVHRRRGGQGTNANLEVIKNYVDTVGDLADYGERSDLVGMAWRVLNGKGKEFEEKTAKTIMWQYEQLDKVENMLDHMQQKNQLVSVFKRCAMGILNGERRNYELEINERLLNMPCIRGLLQPTDPSVFRIFYQDAYNLLLYNFAVNRAALGEQFNLDSLIDTTEDFLGECSSPASRDTGLQRTKEENLNNPQCSSPASSEIDDAAASSKDRQRNTRLQRTREENLDNTPEIEPA